MKLKDFDAIALSDYIVGVNRGMEHIEEFDCKNVNKKAQYSDCFIGSVHVLNKDQMAVNIELGNDEEICLDITKCLTISTYHITEDTALKLEREVLEDKMGLVIYKKDEFGFFVHCPDQITDGLNIPEDLRDCILLAQKHDCFWLCLDRDGEVVDGLDVQIWD